MHESGTAVMTLGRLGRGLGASAQISPEYRYDPMPGHRTASPNQPQNLPRPTLQNGPHALGRLTRTVGNVVEVASMSNLGKVSAMLGAADDPVVGMPEPPAPAGVPPLEYQNPNDPYAQAVRMGYMTPDQVKLSKTITLVMIPVRMVSSAASAYHGYRRNDSIGWAAWWGIMGTIFPIITPTIGLAQGWGKRKR